MAVIARYSFFLAFVLLVFVGQAEAQDFRRQYRNARDLFDAGKYNLAMEAFKPLTVYDSQNPFLEYSSFYYAVSADHLGYAAVAKDQLLQLRKLYPGWNKIDEVNYWLARIYFDQREFFQALLILNELKEPSMQHDVAMMKRHYLSGISDAETLRMAGDDYPNDSEVARALARILAKEAFNPVFRHQFDSIVSRFNFTRNDFNVQEGPVSVKKSKYVVALLFPFIANTLTPSPTASRPNQSILDLYQGIRMAADTLAKKGITIELRAYDTERDIATLKKVLDAPELKNVDLIVGPFFQDQLKLVEQFSMENRIYMINPVSNSSDYIKNNPFGFLFQASHQTLGEQAAEAIADRIKNKNCIVYFGDTPKDSVMAFSFMKRAVERGMNVVLAEEHRRETAVKILSTLTTGTEFDEFRNPKQFTLKLDSIGSIYVASDNALIYSKVNSAVTTRGDSIVVIGSEAWISPDNNASNFDGFERIHILMAAPNYAATNKPTFLDFRRRYIGMHGSYPEFYARLGFEFMLFVGNALGNYGTYFQEPLASHGFQKGYLYEGYDFTTQHENSYVPFVYFKEGSLVVFNPK